MFARWRERERNGLDRENRKRSFSDNFVTNLDGRELHVVRMFDNTNSRKYARWHAAQSAANPAGGRNKLDAPGRGGIALT